MSKTFNFNEMLNTLKTAGFRITLPRSAIIDYLAQRGDHPSAQHIYDEVSRKVPGISLATVYNSLKVLRDLGLVKEIEFEHANNRYDTNLTPHINLVCDECDSITDMELDFPSKPEEVQARYGFQINDCRLEYSGLCSRCRQLTK